MKYFQDPARLWSLLSQMLEGTGSTLLLFALTLPISAYLLGFPLEMLYLTIFVSAMAFWRHRGNIKKLLNGTENKFGSKK